MSLMYHKGNPRSTYQSHLWRLIVAKNAHLYRLYMSVSTLQSAITQNINVNLDILVL